MVTERMLSVDNNGPRYALHNVTRLMHTSYCEAQARKGTGTGMCDEPLDDHGNCPNAGNHQEEGN